MAVYKLLLKSSAAKEIERLPTTKLRRSVLARISRLAAEPRPQGAQKLAGHDDRFRLRQGPYRILYSVDDERREVVIVKVGHRREVYRAG